MQVRRFLSGEEPGLLDIYYSSIHLVARRDYTEEQVNVWVQSNLDRKLWVNRMRGINPFVAEGTPSCARSCEGTERGSGLAPRSS
jgi:putative acetyltransferase